MPLVKRMISRRRPYVRRKSKYPVARRPVRKYRPRAPRTYTKISRMPVSDRLFTKLRYSEGIDWNITLANILYSYTFQTSIYDPDLTATGHQPLWRDQMATMFNRYRVLGIGYKIFWRCTNTAVLTTAYVQHNSTTTTETNYNTLIERNNSKRTYLDSNTGARANYTTGYMSIAKTYGLSKAQFTADDGFDSLIGGNPSKMAYLILYTSSRSSGAVANCQVELTYYVEFFDRVNVAGS
ncbi:capsid protein [Chifec virus UA13_150]|nr:capsid protein [Chifec virus UA13_150]